LRSGHAVSNDVIIAEWTLVSSRSISAGVVILPNHKPTFALNSSS